MHKSTEVRYPVRLWERSGPSGPLIMSNLGPGPKGPVFPFRSDGEKYIKDYANTRDPSSMEYFLLPAEVK